MKKQLFIILFVVFASLSVLNAQTWQFDHSPTRQNLARLDMLSDNTGWAVSYDGLLLHFDKNQWKIQTAINQNQLKLSGEFASVSTVNPKKVGDIYTVRTVSQKSIWLAINNAD
ncbi:MAG: hypothetical protein DWQ10_08620, partial [Calditrichaeota bacterium]